MFPTPPANIMGLSYPQIEAPSFGSSKVLKYPLREGRPNSLLNAAEPIGPSLIISNELANLGFSLRAISQGSFLLGNLK